MDTKLLVDFALSLLPKAGILILFALFDFLGGLYVSWQKNEVNAEELPRFLKTLVGWFYVWITAEGIAFIPGFLGIQMTGLTDAFAQYTPNAVLAFIIITKYGGSILKHYNDIKELNGLKIQIAEDTDPK